MHHIKESGNKIRLHYRHYPQKHIMTSLFFRLTSWYPELLKRNMGMWPWLAMHKNLFAPGAVLNHIRSVEAPGTSIVWASLWQDFCQWLVLMVWVHHNASAGDFKSIVVLIRTSWCIRQTHDFAVLFWCLLQRSSVKLDSLEMISGAAFHITALTKISISSTRLF